MLGYMALRHLLSIYPVEATIARNGVVSVGDQEICNILELIHKAAKLDNMRDALANLANKNMYSIIEGIDGVNIEFCTLNGDRVHYEGAPWDYASKKLLENK